jgi:RES domain-containing protein
VIITAWRLVKTRHLAHAFEGEGAHRFGGRWNSPGVAVVYVAESLALAALEVLVHAQDRAALVACSAIPVRFDERLVRVLPDASLPGNWNRSPFAAATQALGDEWARSAATAVLRVPSAVVSSEHIYVINPAHPAFRRVRIGRAAPFAFDARLVRSGSARG